MSIEPAKLGKAIKEVRGIRGLTQKEVASKTGLTVNYLSLVETGERSITTESLNQVAEALKVPTQWITFLGGDVQVVRGDGEKFRRLDDATKVAIIEMIKADSEQQQTNRPTKR